MERKQARLAMTPELLFAMGSGRLEVISNPLPDDAVMVGAGFDAVAQYFFVVVESATFASVRFGDPLPLLPPPHFRRLE